jgi:hypothetical protein
MSDGDTDPAADAVADEHLDKLDEIFASLDKGTVCWVLGIYLASEFEDKDDLYRFIGRLAHIAGAMWEAIDEDIPEANEEE